MHRHLGSLTDELLNAIGTDIPASVKKTIEKEVEARLLALYATEIRKLAPKLHNLGAKVGDKIAQGIVGAMVIDPKDVQSGGATPEYVTKLVMPILTPFLEGLKSTALPTIKRTAIGLSVLLVGTGVAGGYFLGTRGTRKSLL